MPEYKIPEQANVQAQKILKNLHSKLLRQNQTVMETEEHIKLIHNQLALFDKK